MPRELLLTREQYKIIPNPRLRLPTGGSSEQPEVLIALGNNALHNL